VGNVISSEKRQKMSNVMLATCRSYSAQSFDGCPACVDSALDAVTQASAYLLGRSGPGFATQTVHQADMAHILGVSLCAEDGRKIGADEIEVYQTISAVMTDDEDDKADVVDDGDHEASSMRLDDFQTVIDQLGLAPAGTGSLSGVIMGRLYAFERSIGLFEVKVSPSR
jgi:hypothetical protein